MFFLNFLYLVKILGSATLWTYFRDLLFTRDQYSNHNKTYMSDLDSLTLMFLLLDSVGLLLNHQNIK